MATSSIWTLKNNQSMKHKAYRHSLLLLAIFITGTGLVLADTVDILLGDVNHDGILNVADITAITNIVHERSGDYDRTAADVNQDGIYNVADIIGVTNIVHYGTPSGSTTQSILFFTATSVQKTYGDADFSNTIVRAGSTGAISYAVSPAGVVNVASDGTVTIVGGGTATVTATLAANGTFAGTTASYTVNISKATITDPSTTMATAVTAKKNGGANQTYTGSALALVNAGVSSAGTLKYKVTTTNEQPEKGEGWSETVPTATDAGTYYVWYYADGNDNYNETAVSAEPVTVTIDKANISPSVTMSGWTYGGTASSPSVSGNTGNGSVTYQYKVSTAADGTYTTTRPSDAGTYTVKATVPATTNYNSGTATANFTIAKAAGAATLSATSVSFGTATGNKTVTVSKNTGTVTAKVSSGSGCTVSVSGTTITITRSSNAAFSATITVTIAASTNYNSTTKTFSVSGTSRYAAGLVESATMSGNKCAKVYTSATTGYYIMCTDKSTSSTWSQACGYSVTAGGKTFKCGTKAQWEAIMSACGGTGWNYINSKCSGVTGWSAMSGYYWSSTELSSNASYAWNFYSAGWLNFNYKASSYHVRLVSAF